VVAMQIALSDRCFEAAELRREVVVAAAASEPSVLQLRQLLLDPAVRCGLGLGCGAVRVRVRVRVWVRVWCGCGCGRHSEGGGGALARGRCMRFLAVACLKDH
jgi:hypothetical protein